MHKSRQKTAPPSQTAARQLTRRVTCPVDERRVRPTKALVGTQPHAAAVRRSHRIRRRNPVHQARTVRVAADRPGGRPPCAEIESEGWRLRREGEGGDRRVVRASGGGRDRRERRKGEVGCQGRSARRASSAMIRGGEWLKRWRRSGRRKGTERSDGPE
jgi:hypothetical protein